MANPFLDDQFPIPVRAGASWVDDYTVRIVKTASGAEHRALVHRYPVRSFRVEFRDVRSALWRKVLSLYHRCYGQYAGFRVRCHDDFSTHAYTEAPQPTDFWLGYTNTGIYQLRTIYGAESPEFLPTEWYPWRPIYKPVATTVRVAVNGVQQLTGWTVDDTNGQIVFSSPPAITDTVTAGCEFDLPCRFNSAPQVQALSPDLRDTGTIDLIELLNL